MPIKGTNTEKDQALAVTPQSAWRVKQVIVKRDWCLQVTFMDGLEGTVDLSQRIARKETGVFDLLKDKRFFESVYLDKGIVTWHIALTVF